MAKVYSRRIIFNFIGMDSFRLERISKKKWPNEEIHVVTVRPNDDLTDEKFAVLKDVDRFTQIYMVAHHYPKKAGLFNWDNSHCFTSEWIAALLCHHIQSNEVCLKAIPAFLPFERQLEIHMIACHSSKRLGIWHKGPSFAEKLFIGISTDKANPLSVEIHAPKMFVVPIPCAEEDFRYRWKALIKQPSYNQDWHVRYIDAPIWRGQLSLRRGYAFYSFFSPGIKPPGNYKQIIKASVEKDPGYRIMTVKEYEAEQSDPLAVETDLETKQSTTFGVDGSVSHKLLSSV